MSNQITTAFVRQYSANVEHLVQQMGSRLRGAVRVEGGITGEQAFFDQVGVSEATKRTSRHSDTPIVNAPHARRRVALVDYEWGDLVDQQDKIRTLIDPTNPYSQSAAWAMGRAMDDEVIAAALGIAYTDKTGSTSTSLPSAQKVAVASTGLTLAKLLSAKEILDAADVDPSIPRFIALSAEQVTDLLNTTEIKDADYNTVKALAAGQVNSFLGFTFIRTERLTTDSNGDRQVIAWAKDGILLGIGQDAGGSIDKRPDKGNAMQVYYKMTIGATRMQESKVVEIAALES